MHFNNNPFITEKAKAVLRVARFRWGIKAPLKRENNFNRAWVRKRVVSALENLGCEMDYLYPPKSLFSLMHNAPADLVQISSHISLKDYNEIKEVNFGGTNAAWHFSTYICN